MKKSIILLLFAFHGTLWAQVNPLVEQQARSAIEARGLEEGEVRARLKAKGIDIDNVKPADLPQLQPQIEAVLNEMEAEKKGAAPPTATPPVSAPAPPAQAPILPSESTAKPSTAEKVAETLSQRNIAALPPTDIYGHHLFRQKDVAIFRTTNEVKPPDSYILSTGDELTVSVFGASQFDAKFTLNKEGYITPSGMPKVFLKGLSLEQAKGLLRSRFANFYRFAPEQFAVSLSTARTITVHIFGEASNVGSFTVSAVNTAFNALVAAGGPTDLGTVRQIKVLRGNKAKILDLYAFLDNPALQYDFFLEDNDLLHVPLAQRVVSVQGAVRRPFRYELLPTENLFKLLDLAGGLTASAYNEVIQVRRYVENRQVLIDIPLRELVAQKSDFPLLNGDEIAVRTVTLPIQNTAGIEGNVAQPGTYALSETKRLSDLLKKGGLRPESRTDVAFLTRKNADSTYQLLQVNLDQALAQTGGPADLPLQAGDVLRVYAKARYADRYTISVRGAVREAIKDQPFDPQASITVEKAILLAGGLSADANGLGYLLRVNPRNTKEKNYLPVNLEAILRDPKSPANVALQPQDELLVLSNLTYTDQSQIIVAGAVRVPGTFQYAPSLTLRDALTLAGGMKLEAARNRVDIYRVQIRENTPTRTLAYQLEVDANYNAVQVAQNGQPAVGDLSGGSFALAPFDEVVVRTVPDFEFQKFIEINGEVAYAGRYALARDNETLSDLVARAGGLTPEADAKAATLFRSYENKGFVVTDLQRALAKPSSAFNHVLRDGDIINIPPIKALVSIRVANTEAPEIYRPELIQTGQINVAYHNGHRAGWYVRHYAGGFADDARRNKVSVQHPNGRLRRTVNYGLFRAYPKVVKGATILVPAKDTKTPKTEKKKKEVDWDKKLTQFLAVASLVSTTLIGIATLQVLNK